MMEASFLLSLLAQRPHGSLKPIAETLARCRVRTNEGSRSPNSAKFKRSQVGGAQFLLACVPPEESLGMKGLSRSFTVAQGKRSASPVEIHGGLVAHREAVVQATILVEPRRIERGSTNGWNLKLSFETKVHACINYRIKSFPAFLHQFGNALERMKLTQAISE